MICRNCGKQIEDNSLFCPSCGGRIEDMINSERKSAAVSDVFSGTQTTDEAAYVQAAERTAQKPPKTDEQPANTAAAYYEQPSTRKEKEFFGAGAFALCLAVIAVLAGTAGTFAYLYFAAIGAI